MFFGGVCMLDYKSSGGEKIVGCRLLGRSGVSTNRAYGQIDCKDN